MDRVVVIEIPDLEVAVVDNGDLALTDADESIVVEGEILWSLRAAGIRPGSVVVFECRITETGLGEEEECEEEAPEDSAE